MPSPSTSESKDPNRDHWLRGQNATGKVGNASSVDYTHGKAVDQGPGDVITFLTWLGSVLVWSLKTVVLLKRGC